jgi:hypothetical protein
LIGGIAAWLRLLNAPLFEVALLEVGLAARLEAASKALLLVARPLLRSCADTADLGDTTVASAARCCAFPVGDAALVTEAAVAVEGADPDHFWYTEETVADGDGAALPAFPALLGARSARKVSSSELVTDSSLSVTLLCVVEAFFADRPGVGKGGGDARERVAARCGAVCEDSGTAAELEVAEETALPLVSTRNVLRRAFFCLSSALDSLSSSELSLMA